MNKATWKKGKKTIKGVWQYHWASDRFWIRLNGKDPETGMEREAFSVAGEQPNFSGWKLVEEEKK